MPKSQETPNASHIVPYLDGFSALYIVQPDDTLWGLSKQFDTNVSDLKKWNSLYGDVIYPGQQLKVAVGGFQDTWDARESGADFAFWFIVFFIFLRVGLIATQRLKVFLSKQNSMPKRLRLRAVFAHMASVFTIILMLVSVIAGIYLFYAAGSIADQETKTNAGYAIAPPLPMGKSDKVEYLQLEVDSLKNQLSSEVSEAEQRGLRMERLISTIATRLGAIALLLFLVKILVPIYRYNMKLAGYYHARADALEMLGEGRIDEILPLIEALTPSDVVFGKEPSSSPLQKLAGLPGAAVSKVAGEITGKGGS